MERGTLDCALCVSSLDEYADLWPPFFNLVSRHWPDCPFPIYLGVGTKKFEHPQVRTIPSAPHTNWSDRAREHLAAVPNKYVLLMLDDWFLKRRVDTQAICHFLSLLEIYDGHMLRLVPDPKPDHAIAGHPSLGMMGIGTPNRTNTHATIWRKEALLSILRAGETLWEFEVHGSIRSNAYSGGMFSVWRPALHYEGVISRGKWERGAARRYARLDIGCDLNARPKKSMREALKLKFTRTVHPILRSFLPMRLRQRLQRTLFGRSAYPRDL